MSEQPPILDYRAEPVSRSRVGRELLWWLPAMALFVAGFFLEPDHIGVRYRSQMYPILVYVSGWYFTCGVLYVPAMILLRLVRRLRRR